MYFIWFGLFLFWLLSTTFSAFHYNITHHCPLESIIEFLKAVAISGPTSISSIEMCPSVSISSKSLKSNVLDTILIYTLQPWPKGYDLGSQNNDIVDILHGHVDHLWKV